VLLRILREIFSGAPRAAKPEPVASDNPLLDWFSKHDGRYVYKWRHYFDIYHRHFARYRGRSPVVLEIGVFHGGSLDMWRDYFGAGCRLYGVDIEPRCRMFETGGTKIFIGDQADRGFLQQLRREIPRVDILIDDGGHTMQQQITTFEELFPHVADDGVYLCEDLHTSYWDEFGGGYLKPGSFIEFSKLLVDQLNAWHSADAVRFQSSDFTRTAGGMHFYDSVLVIDRKIVTQPRLMKAGKPSF
jgi:hypothetical protein